MIRQLLIPLWAGSVLIALGGGHAVVPVAAGSGTAVVGHEADMSARGECVERSDPSGPPRTNLFALSANSAAFTDCVVTVEGYLLFDRESTYLFPTKAFSAPPLYSYAVQLVLHDATGGTRGQLESGDGFVVVTGRFSPTERVRGAGGIGSLYQISRVLRVTEGH